MRKNSKTKRIVALIMAFMFIFTSFFTPEIAKAITPEKKVKITFSLEQRVLGKPDIIPSQEVEITEGEQASIVLDRMLKSNGIEYDYTGSLEGGFYLAGICYNGEWLREKQNGVMSGWMYQVNGKMPNIGMSGWHLLDGDVFRVHYTAQKFGEDIKYVDNIFLLREKISKAKKITSEEYNIRSFNKLQNCISKAESILISNEEIGKRMVEKSCDGKIDLELLNGRIRNYIEELDKAIENLIPKNPTVEDLRKECANNLEVFAENFGNANIIDDDYYNDEELISKLGRLYDDLEEVLSKQDYAEFEELEELIEIVEEDSEKLKNLLENSTPDKTKVNNILKELIERAAESTIKEVKKPSYRDGWSILALARSGVTVPEGYYEKFYKEVERKAKRIRLKSARPLDIENYILSVSAIGKDASNVSEINLIDILCNIEDVEKQGVLGVCYGLIALDSNNYKETENCINSRESLINKLLEYKTEDGGFSLTKGSKVADVDITAIALQALSNYKDKEEIKNVIDSSVELLRKNQLNNGGYSSIWSGEVLEDADQVVVALSSLKKDMMNPENGFLKENGNLLSYIKGYENPKGGFFHSKDKTNGTATEQTLYSLVSYYRLINNENNLYDMKDANPGSGEFNLKNECINKLNELKEKIKNIKSLKEEDYTKESYEKLRISMEETQKNLDKLSSSIETSNDEGLKNILNILESKINLLNSSTDSLVKNSEERPTIDLKSIINKTAEKMLKDCPNAKYGKEWYILGLARAGYNVPKDYYENYYKSVEEEIIDEEGDFSSATELERIIIALNAIDKDPTNVGGYNLVNLLWNFEDINMQGLNGPVFALLALDSKKYAEPEKSINTRENLINEILKYKTKDGGFSLMTGSDKADIDMTAMTLQALSNYIDNPKVNEAVKSSLKILSDKQLENGGYNSPWSGENVQSADQVIVALCALGQNLLNSTNGFVKEKGNLLSYIMAYRNENGAFEHPKGTPNSMATEQTMYALIAYDRLLDNKNKLYDMTEEVEKKLKDDCLVKCENLKEKIASVKSLKESDYTRESYDILKNAINDARSYLEEIKISIPKSKKEELVSMLKVLDSKIKDLDKAVSSLVKNQMPPTPIPTINVEDVINRTGQKILEYCGEAKYGNEWFVLGLSRAGFTVPQGYYENYYKSVEEKVKSLNGEFRKVTDIERVVIALTSIGKDPTNVAGYNLVESIWNFEDVTVQGLNGPVFALIALDTNSYKEPVKCINTREKLINEILKYKTKDGGFSLNLNDDKADVDMTAMTLQALCKYTSNPQVNDAIKSSLKILSEIQLQNGGYSSMWSGENVQSPDQVIVALCALNKDLLDVSNGFVKPNGNLISYILTYENKDGGFEHPKGMPNGMATEQSMYTLVAYDRFLKGKNRLYDMSDVAVDSTNNGGISADVKGKCATELKRLKEKLKEAKDIKEEEYTKESYEKFKKSISELESGIEKVEDNLSKADNIKAATLLQNIKDYIEKVEDILKILVKKDNTKLEILNNEAKIKVKFEKGVLPEGSEIKVENLKEKNKEKYDLVTKTINSYNKKSNVILLYDIKIEKDGKIVEPKGYVNVTLELPKDYSAKKDTSLKVVKVLENGKINERETVIEGRNLTFKTDEFSLYSVIEIAESNANAGKEDNKTKPNSNSKDKKADNKKKDNKKDDKGKNSSILNKNKANIDNGNISDGNLSNVKIYGQVNDTTSNLGKEKENVKVPSKQADGKGKDSVKTEINNEKKEDNVTVATKTEEKNIQKTDKKAENIDALKENNDELRSSITDLKNTYKRNVIIILIVVGVLLVTSNIITIHIIKKKKAK